MKKLVLVGFVISLLMMRYLPGSGQTSGRSVITPDNAKYLRPIQTLGRGRAMDIDWVGDTFVVVSSTGLWLYPARDFNAEPEFLPGGHGWIHSFAVSPDGHVATGNDDGTITLWNLTDKSSKTFVAHGLPVLSLDFNSDGSQLVSGSGDIMGTMALSPVDDNTVKVWDIKTGELIRDWRGSGYGSVESVKIHMTRFAKDDTWIAAIGDEGYSSDVSMLELKFFNVATGDVDVDTTHRGGVYKSSFIAFNPDGKTFFTDRGVWDSVTHQRIQQINQNFFSDAVYNSDGTRLAVVTTPFFYDEDPHTLYLWDTTTWQLLANFGKGEGATHVAFSPDSHQIAVIQSDERVVIRDIASQHQIATLDDYATYATSVAVSSDSQWVAMAVQNQGVQLYDASTLTWLETIDIPYATAIAFSPDNALLAITSEASFEYVSTDGVQYQWGDGNIVIWDMARHRIVQQSEDLKSESSVDNSRLVFSTDGKILMASLSCCGLFLWNTQQQDPPIDLQMETGKDLRSPLMPGVTPDTVIVGIGWTLSLYDRSTSTSILTFTNYDFFSALAYSPDKALLAGASRGFYGSGALIIWDTMTWAVLAQTGGRWVGLTDVTFSADGSLLVYAVYDGTLHFLDTTTWQEIAVLQGYQGPLDSLTFGMDGTYLLASTGSGVVQVWGIEGDE